MSDSGNSISAPVTDWTVPQPRFVYVDAAPYRVVNVYSNVLQKRLSLHMSPEPSTRGMWQGDLFALCEDPQWQTDLLEELMAGVMVQTTRRDDQGAFYWTIYTFLLREQPDVESMWLRAMRKFDFCIRAEVTHGHGSRKRKISSATTKTSQRVKYISTTTMEPPSADIIVKTLLNNSPPPREDMMLVLDVNTERLQKWAPAAATSVSRMKLSK